MYMASSKEKELSKRGQELMARVESGEALNEEELAELLAEMPGG
jgi:hypothetical protein